MILRLEVKLVKMKSYIESCRITERGKSTRCVVNTNIHLDTSNSQP
jgi:hypothetical protein